MKVSFFLFLISQILTTVVSAGQPNCAHQKPAVLDFFPKTVLTALESALDGEYHMGSNSPVSAKVISGTVLNACTPSADQTEYVVSIDFSLQAMDDDTLAPVGKTFKMHKCLLAFSWQEKVSGDGNKWVAAEVSGSIDCRTSEFQLLLEQQQIL